MACDFFRFLLLSFLYPFLYPFFHAFLYAFFQSSFLGLDDRSVDGVFPVAVHLEAFFVAVVFLFGELGYLGGLEELGEHFLLQGERAFHQAGQVAQHEQPLVEHAVQLVFPFVEFGHFEVDERELVVEHVLRLAVGELHLVVEVAFVLVVEGEVEDTDDVHGLEAVVPVSPLALFLDGESGVVEAAVLEELLFPALHFY